MIHDYILAIVRQSLRCLKLSLGNHIPLEHVPERTNRVDMCIDKLCNATGEEIPDNNPSIVAANSQQCSLPVKSTRDGNTHTVQVSVKILWEVLTK